MEKIMNNPGLQHLAENVFWNLDVEDLKICAQINQSCKQILQIKEESIRLDQSYSIGEELSPRNCYHVLSKMDFEERNCGSSLLFQSCCPR